MGRGTAKFLLWAALLFLAAGITVSGQMVLYDNGPLVNSPGTGAGGADESVLQTSSLMMNTYGFGHQYALVYRMADDFTVASAAGWDVQTIDFYAYQTGSTTTSPITGVYLQIWNGPPDNPGSSVVWGDLTTNRLSATTFSNIYRVTETASGNTQRPIMMDTVTVGTILPPGTYWLDWTTDGSGASGPWAPPVTIAGQTVTGNALQYTSSWAAALDSGTSTQQGMPFVIKGSLGYNTNFLDEYGRSQACLNRTTGAFIWNILTGPSAGYSVTGTAMARNGGTLFYVSTPAFYFYCSYDPIRKRATGYFYDYGCHAYSSLYDANTTDNPPGCSPP